MPDGKTIGLVVPEAADVTPAEARSMYPHLSFISRGIALQSLSTAGYDEAIGRVVPAAKELAAQGASAVMVIGTSLTFYRGAAFNAALTARISDATGLLAGTMSGALADALHEVGAKRLAVTTAYSAEVNGLLAAFLHQKGFEVRALATVRVASRVGEAARTAEQDIHDVSIRSCREAGDADGVLIVCGGLRTLEVTPRIEADCGVPVVSSMPAAIWAAARLVGEPGHVEPARYGRLLDGKSHTPHRPASGGGARQANARSESK